MSYDYWTGTFENVKASLIRSVAQYAHSYSEVKVGITNNPERRAREHNAGGWAKMIVKYQTSSARFVNEMERTIVAYHWNVLANEVAGGGGPDAAVGPYYLYILIK